MKDKIISHSSIKRDYLQYIDEHEHFPEEAKQEMKTLVSNQLSIISRQMGLIELTHKRAKEIKCT